MRREAGRADLSFRQPGRLCESLPGYVRKFNAASAALFPAIQPVDDLVDLFHIRLDAGGLHFVQTHTLLGGTYEILAVAHDSNNRNAEGTKKPH